MSHVCENCGAVASRKVPVSVNNPHDEKRHYCDACFEAYYVGLQHGRYHEAARYGCKPGRDSSTDKPKPFAFYHVHTFDHSISMMVGANSYRHAAQIVADFIAGGDPPGDGGLCWVTKLCAPDGGGTGHYTAMVEQDEWFNIRPNRVSKTTAQDRRVINYLEHEGNRCPFCGDSDIEAGGTTSYDHNAVEVSCHHCDKTWEDIYTLTNVDLGK